MVRTTKGRVLYLFDSVDFAHRRFFQYVNSLRSVEVNANHKLHVLCIRRNEYIQPAINCINSFWQFHPEFRVIIWSDSERMLLLKDNFKKFHRIDRLDIVEIEPKNRWQETKLEIICNKLRFEDIFSDADMFWNSRLSLDTKPLFFLKEYEFDQYSLTKRVRELLKLDSSRDWHMLNVSVVNLGKLSQNSAFAERAFGIFHTIMNIHQDRYLGSSEILQLHRMAEQISLSITVQEFGDYSFLKDKDSIMDGGIAESFYLGARNGF